MLLCVHNVFQITHIMYGLQANLSGKFVDGRRVVCLLHVLIYLIILVKNYLAELYYFQEKIWAFPTLFFYYCDSQIIPPISLSIRFC